MKERIGFLSTRFAGTDGVSLETNKWSHVFEAKLNHKTFWYAGRIDKPAEISFCVPEAHFGFPENEWINKQIWGYGTRSSIITKRIRDLADYLKETIYEFVGSYDITILVLENVLSIPMHVPLGIAVTEFLSETQMPSIGHHHDFYWERSRFLVSAVQDYLDMAFPPRSHSVQHVVINQSAQEELSWRKGVPAMLVPNVFDFDSPPPMLPDEYTSDIRAEIGLTPDDVMILQPTRIVPRKGIEHAIHMVAMLEDPKYKLVVSHEAGDEGFEYRNMLAEYAAEEGVDLRFIATRIGEYRQLDSQGKKIYTLWDLYPHADLVTYLSLYEGFGNALLEGFYFKKPIIVNRYSIYARDIEPKGFLVPAIDGYITRRFVDEVRRLIEDENHRNHVINHNYKLARRFYSYEVLQRKLNSLVANLRGV
ncbi:MAG: glycosyltransferase family 4 protein [Candidatus Hinthialibacter antarcticus]|nr:glycosyltransferase family 4 protein [Candidatus Hinthialibacter antarcticus]